MGRSVQLTQPFGDYLWSVPLNQFELVMTSAAPGGYYPLRSLGQIWLNYWLGLLLDTTGRPNGLNKISIKLFSAEAPAAEIGSAADPGRFASVMIDNTVPVVNLQQILQQPGNVPVNVCAIVNTGDPTFTFRITASAPQSHLLAWDLTAYWGDNKSKSVSSDSYNNHISPSRLWAGVSGVVVPPPGPGPLGCQCPERSDLEALCAFVLAERLGPSDQRLGIHTRRRQLSKVRNAVSITRRWGRHGSASMLVCVLRNRGDSHPTILRLNPRVFVPALAQDEDTKGALVESFQARIV